MGHRLQQFLSFGRIIDLGEFLRQIQVIPADDAILDVLMSRLQASAISWSSFSACRNSRGLPTETARVKAWTCSMPLSTFSMDIARKMKTRRCPALRSHCTRICSAIRC